MIDLEVRHPANCETTEPSVQASSFKHHCACSNVLTDASSSALATRTGQRVSTALAASSRWAKTCVQRPPSILQALAVWLTSWHYLFNESHHWNAPVVISSVQHLCTTRTTLVLPVGSQTSPRRNPTEGDCSLQLLWGPTQRGPAMGVVAQK